MPTSARSEDPIRFVTRLLVAGYLVEAGVLLVLAPWTRLWEHNVFVEGLPLLGSIAGSLFVRGAISGVGIVTFIGGLRDLASVLMARRAGPDDETSSGQPAAPPARPPS